MALRLLKIVAPIEKGKEIVHLLSAQPELNYWQEEATANQFVVSIITSTGQSEEIMDLLERTFSHTEGFCMVLMAVEAVVPRIEEPVKQDKQQSNDVTPKAPSIPLRISREELPPVYEVEYQPSLLR